MNANSMHTVGVVGVVVIGRNEGERLQRCLRSLTPHAQTIVYVDSGSSDGSQAFAQSLGVDVVALDMTTPFTAARARNAGLSRLLELAPNAAFVQFVDGDCEVDANWLAAGAHALANDAAIAAVSGRLKERFPEKSLYNRLADMEWDRPVGEEKSCGGNAMMRIEAVEKVGRFDPTLIAGEEPELCARMRQAGYRIVRLPDAMALHDLAMFTTSQWMTRARRHGYAMLEVSHFKTPASKGLFNGQIRSALIWGLAWPIAAGALAIATIVCFVIGEHRAGAIIGGATGMAFLAMNVQVLKIARRARGRGLQPEDARDFGRLTMQSKVENVRGMAQFLLRRLRGAKPKVIDYKARA